jgi:hypothetical protein
MTCARDNKAAFNSNEGFSVVAPTNKIVPSSINGKNPSCWALLKRWISSTNSKRTFAVLAAHPRGLKHFLQIRNASEDRRNLDKGQICRIRQ